MSQYLGKKEGTLKREQQKMTVFYKEPPPLILSLKTGEQRKVATRRESSSNGLPVAGFRPVRSFFSLTQNFPNLLISTPSTASWFPFINANRCSRISESRLLDHVAFNGI